MIEHADEFLQEKLKTFPAGIALRGTGIETVGASMPSIITFLNDNRDIIEEYFSYKDEEDSNEN